MELLRKEASPKDITAHGLFLVHLGGVFPSPTLAMGTNLKFYYFLSINTSQLLLIKH